MYVGRTAACLTISVLYTVSSVEEKGKLCKMINNNISSVEIEHYQ